MPEFSECSKKVGVEIKRGSLDRDYERMEGELIEESRRSRWVSQEHDKSRQVVPCRVVNIRNYPNLRGYAEIEFFQSVKGFWGL